MPGRARLHLAPARAVVDLEEQTLRGEPTTPVEAKPAACAWIEGEDAEIGMRAEVRHQRIVQVRGHGESEEMLVDGHHEAGGPREQGCPRTAVRVERGGNREPLDGQDGRQLLGDLRGDDLPDTFCVIPRVQTALDLDLPRMEVAHALQMPTGPKCDRYLISQNSSL